MGSLLERVIGFFSRDIRSVSYCKKIYPIYLLKNRDIFEHNFFIKNPEKAKYSMQELNKSSRNGTFIKLNPPVEINPDSKFGILAIKEGFHKLLSTNSDPEEELRRNEKANLNWGKYKANGEYGKYGVLYTCEQDNVLNALLFHYSLRLIDIVKEELIANYSLGLKDLRDRFRTENSKPLKNTDNLNNLKKMITECIKNMRDIKNADYSNQFKDMINEYTELRNDEHHSHVLDVFLGVVFSFLKNRCNDNQPMTRLACKVGASSLMQRIEFKKIKKQPSLVVVTGTAEQYEVPKDIHEEFE